MIPEFDERGYLPAGVHDASWREFAERYAITEHRRALTDKLALLVRHLKTVGCRTLYVDGSFVTDKVRPNDYDACWDVQGVKIEKLDKALLEFSDAGKKAMEVKYGGDIRPDAFSPTELDTSYLEFFQVDRNGERKGIVRLVLTEVEP
jgi:hypothetical protein